jgi:hypothetical protein
MGRRASKHQVAAANAGPGHQLLEHDLVPFLGQQLLHRALCRQIGEVMPEAGSSLVSNQQLSHTGRLVLFSLQQSRH